MNRLPPAYDPRKFNSTIARTEWGEKQKKRKTPELDFQRAVEDLAEDLGWYVFHLYNPVRSKAGFPDLMLVRERVVWAELKAKGGKIRPEQRYFLDMLKAAGQETYEWWDTDATWEEIAAVLSKGGAVTAVMQ